MNVTRHLAGKLCVVATVLSVLASEYANAQTTAGSTPCLQQLNDQKGSPAKEEPAKPEKPGWFSQNASKILGVVGAAGGAVVGKVLCDKLAPQQRGGCMVAGGVGGALLGSQLGKMLSEADKKRYQETSYKVAITGRPQSVSLDNGCMVVEPTSAEAFEERQVDLAFGPSVATPQKLRAVAMPYVRPSSANVAAGPSAAKGTTVAANVPSFVMGSTDSGRYLLLGREDPDQGFVGAGYVEANGWVASPDSAPTSMAGDGGQPKVVKVGVEVPCRQISSSIRVEASNKTETYAGKVCRLPNGISEAN